MRSLALQSLESNPQLSFATRMEDWTCLGQHKRQPEFPVVTRESRRNSRKTTWLPRHRKMKPFPATAPQEKSHVRNWRSKGHLAPLMRPTKFPEIPVSLRHSSRGLVGGCRFRRTPISRSPLDKSPMPGHLSELHTVNEVNTKGQFFRASFGKKPQVPNTARQAASLPGDISRGKRSSKIGRASCRERV